MSKLYTIIIEQTNDGFKMNRENIGFTVFELLGFVTHIQHELLKQAASMDINNTEIARTFNIPFRGKIEVIEDKVEITKEKENE